jgi:RNA 3'-terminal phosphate cyclase (ATP)
LNGVRRRGAPDAFFGFGARGKPAERVADEAADLHHHLAHPGALDPHAADQFVLPLALAPDQSEFTTTKVTDHLITHVELLRRFLGREIDRTDCVDEPGTVTIKLKE